MDIILRIFFLQIYYIKLFRWYHNDHTLKGVPIPPHSTMGTLVGLRGGEVSLKLLAQSRLGCNRNCKLVGTRMCLLDVQGGKGRRSQGGIWGVDGSRGQATSNYIWLRVSLAHCTL